MTALSLAALASVGTLLIAMQSIHLPASLGSMPVTALPRYYGRSDSCRPALRTHSRHEHLHFTGRSPCFMYTIFRPFRLQPPDGPRRRFVTLPFSATSFRIRSGLRLWLAGSPHHPAESSSSSYGLVRSPPVALHLASRRRSYIRLQAGERLPGEDFHLADHVHSQTH